MQLVFPWAYLNNTYTGLLAPSRADQPDSHNEMTDVADEGRVVDVVYLDYSKAFDIISCNILIDKVMK